MPKPLYRFKRHKMIGLRSRPVNFKEVFTVRTLQFQINPFFTVTQMIDSLRPILAVQFNINSDDIEIVESGQYMNGGLAEEAPCLVPSDRRLCDIWGQDLRNVSFYIRRKNFIYPQIERSIREREENQRQTSNIVISSFIGECPICLESTSVTRRYNCSHGVCATCYGRCQESSIMGCSLCRAH